ncbi:uncharacterized protein LOC110270981 [Arachis ipaensis]|uniref:uncharacterized protein LOC110270981 n=1 Tax=Arachis ipaensis TaxID=130454 RepID=UPI000A2AF2B4|nr:uncharacterized protein LOC110270981 [Arachis ipaensis]XP_025646762.1 uncharacterized protein LOC112741842 [Arachis hypogaea]
MVKFLEHLHDKLGVREEGSILFSVPSELVRHPSVSLIQRYRVQYRRTRQIIGIGCKVGRLFELKKLYVPSTSNLCVVSSASTLHLWYHRLAHRSLRKLRPLVSKGVLGQFNNESFDCTSCQIAKQPALSFHDNSFLACSSFDLIHSDVWGPASITSIGEA